MEPKFDKKKLKSLLSILDTIEWLKKPSHATVPLKLSLIPKIFTSFFFIFSGSVADPGCLSRIPDPTFFHPGSRIRTVSIPDPGSSSKNLSILTPKKAKKWFLSSKKYDPGYSSRIPDPDADFLPSRIPDPGVKKAPNSGSRIPDPDPQHCFPAG
jgi:hypothetical protein